MMTKLSEKFYEAVAQATRIHDGQVRKSCHTPYIAHPYAVAMLVLQHGGDEEQAIAALLHDVIEDQGHKITLDDIEEQYGTRVRNIVDNCSEVVGQPGVEKPPWKKRKAESIEKMKDKPLDALLVSCADKVHNLQSLTQTYKKEGEALWQQFKGGKEGSLWYHRKLSTIFMRRLNNDLANDHRTMISTLEDMIQKNASPSP